MTDAEKVRLYADLLWWVLILLAAWGIPTVIGGIAVMFLRLRWLMDGPRPAPEPPTFDEWMRQQRTGVRY